MRINWNNAQGGSLPANGRAEPPEPDISCCRMGKDQPGRLGGHCPQVKVILYSLFGNFYWRVIQICRAERDGTWWMPAEVRPLPEEQQETGLPHQKSAVCRGWQGKKIRRHSNYQNCFFLSLRQMLVGGTAGVLCSILTQTTLGWLSASSPLGHHHVPGKCRESTPRCPAILTGSRKTLASDQPKRATNAIELQSNVL